MPEITALWLRMGCGVSKCLGCPFLFLNGKLQTECRQHGLKSRQLRIALGWELAYGIEKSARPEKNRDALDLFLAPLEIQPFDDRAAFECGRIRARLERKGTPIGAMDMLIAAHAIRLGVTLVTNNAKEFKRVPDLIVENWV